MLRLILAAAVLATAVPAAAEDWRLVRVAGQAPNRSAVLIDASSIDRSDPQKPVFRIVVLLETMLNGNVRYLDGPQRIDCVADTIAILGGKGFGEDGNLILNDPSETSQPIVPGQPASVYRGAACEGQWAPEVLTVGDKTPVAIAAELFGG